ncbi:maltose Oacetyltransferase [Acanthamoeba castellanii str. Neff]|uniref:Maltose Oacetyltransferase n=1 Tax=Acanthamoeba castellanii (strain ATCC 30010 / Neff) TaxID=1257118 RepID=L8H4H0_ACACF|nr:maltose Oacetyltransferase [Acanthamoeba castellanii str. Neff]ELR19371.1 maltose Oacetyltransferase [Acanthamoeba castellanii str. Neff]
METPAEMTQRERMLSGLPYEAWDPELVRMRHRARRLLREHNATTEEEPDKRSALLKELLGAGGEGAYIEPPFYCDYGTHIKVGKGFYMNFDCVILDCAMVEIGDNVLCAPKVQLYAATHPLDAAERIKGPELAKPIKIGNNVWLGGGAIVCPGVTIGDNTTIGAGSVVTKDIPANVLAAGNPCRVIKQLAPPASTSSETSQ